MEMLQYAAQTTSADPSHAKRLPDRADRLVLKWGLTFDMRRGAKGAKRPLGRRLDGRVRPRAHAMRTSVYVLADALVTAAATASTEA